MSGYIGIDNGLQGAIAVIKEFDDPWNNSIEVFKMPVVGTRKKRINEIALLHILESAAGEGSLCTVEAVNMGPGHGKTQCVRLAQSQYLAIGILVALRIPYQIVAARTWQKAMFTGLGKTDTKTVSLLTAKRLFPDVSLLPTDKCTKDDHNMADALLMAEYGRRTGENRWIGDG